MRGSIAVIVFVALAASLVLMVQARREPYKCNPNAATVASAAAAAGLSSGEIIAAAAAVGGGTALGIALSDEAKKKEKEEQAAGGGGGGGSTPSGNPFCKTLRFGTGKVVAACVKVGDKTPQQTLGEPTPAAQWDCQFFEVQAEGKTWHYRDCKKRGGDPAPGPKPPPSGPSGGGGGSGNRPAVTASEWYGSSTDGEWFQKDCKSSSIDAVWASSNPKLGVITGLQLMCADEVAEKTPQHFGTIGNSAAGNGKGFLTQTFPFFNQPTDRALVQTSTDRDGKQFVRAIGISISDDGKPDKYLDAGFSQNQSSVTQISPLKIFTCPKSTTAGKRSAITQVQGRVSREKLHAVQFFCSEI